MFSLTTKYALRGLRALSLEDPKSYVSLKVLADKSDVPAPYLAKVMKQLAARGLIESKKGLNGGFRMNQQGPPLSLYDLCVSLEDPVTRERCIMGRAECGTANSCAYHQHWAPLRGRITKFLHDTILWTPGCSKPRKGSPQNPRQLR